MDIMKIAFLSEKYTPDIGGLAISTERLARLLTSAGHNVRLFCPSSGLLRAEKRTLTHSGVSVTRFGAHKRVDDTLVDWFELVVAEHKREPFDVLHAYFLTQAGFVATYAGKYLDIPSVVSIRGNDIERAAFDPSRFSHTMYALQNASAVTTNASELVKKAKALIDRDIILIPNGVDAELFMPVEKNLGLAETLGLLRNVILSEATLVPGAHLPWRAVPGSAGADLSSDLRDSSAASTLPHTVPASLRESDMPPIIGFVGELREKKGLKTLLSAYATINKKQPATLLIVGEVRQGEDKKVFDEFQLTNPQLPIIVTGYISPKDLPAYYSLIDVCVHPSLRDGMPNAVLEAMACEKAVVATPVGGILDVIKDSENGSTVPANDAESLSKAILELLNDQTLRVRLGKSARATIQKDFTLQKELDANLNVYESLGL
jgi:glycosyltransferase involved in cell wall biosynthesis